MKNIINILYVDDYFFDRELVKDVLERESDSFKVTEAASRDEFEKLLAEKNFDLVLSDFNILGFEGLQVIEAVKQKDPFLPVVIVTGTGSEDIAVKAMKLGAADYVIKSPEHILRLPKTIMAAIDKHRLENKYKITAKALENRSAELAKRIKEIDCLYGVTMLVMERNLSFEDLAQKIVNIIPSAWQYPEITCAKIVINDRNFQTENYFKTKWNQATYIFVDGVSVGHIEICYIKQMPDNYEGPFLKEERILLETIAKQIGKIIEKYNMEQDHKRLSTAIEQAAESVVITDSQGIIQYVNKAFEKITGYLRKEAVGQNPKILQSEVHDAAFYKKLWAQIAGGNIWHGHFTNKKKDGSFYEEEATITPVKDQKGAISNYVGVKRDVTREMELEKRLVHAEKMEAIGTLAGGIAHDFNNILLPITGYTEMTMAEVSKESKVYSNMEKILYAAERAKELVNQILFFSRQKEMKPKPVDIRPIIKDTLKLLRSSLPATIKIRQNIDEDCGMIVADPTQIYQVVMNLCTNAYHAMLSKGGNLDIDLKKIIIGTEDLYRYPKVVSELTPGTYIKLSISDTGEGMDEKVKAKIFEPYFTTKQKGKGTGLGLATAHGIIKSHGGHVLVSSEPGKGSTFNVYFLQIDGDFKIHKTIPEEKLLTGNEKILLVDDEKYVADVEKKMLEYFGYQVAEFYDSKKALKIFAEKPDDFNIIITDQTMPDITGVELAENILKIKPDIPIILLTGFSDQVSEDKARKAGVKEYIMKPVVMKKLAETVRMLLDD